MLVLCAPSADSGLPASAMSAPLPSAGESSDALVQAASSGDGPMLGDIAAPTAGATTGSTVGGSGGVSGSSMKKLKNLQAANIYFAAHSIAKTDTNYAKFAGTQRSDNTMENARGSVPSACSPAHLLFVCVLLSPRIHVEPRWC